MLLIVIVGLVIGNPRPAAKLQNGVLAYATSTSAYGLLDATNQQRAGNGKPNLSINAQLNSAAQAKADDMVARNYWSHNTPDGQQWYIFIQNAGYKYLKAGENLAYGYATSNDTITGWMNSSTHKANMLDSTFTEVGFGIANGNDYNQSGPETVVVAAYGQPQVLAASTPASSPTPVSSSKPAANSKASATPVTAPPPSTTTSTPSSDVAKPLQTSLPSTKPIQPVVEPASMQITRIQTLTKGRMPWIVLAVTSVSGLAALVLLLRHGWGIRRIFKDSENFILNHPLLDTILVTIIMIGYVLTRTSGVIR